jgi:outer membrane protein assembly factor BamB
MTVATALAAGFPAAEDFAATAADGPSKAAAAPGAAERGWFGLARELGQRDGGENVGPTGFVARLDALERAVDLAARDHGRGQALRWATGTCRTLWRHDLAGGVIAAPPVVAGDLVLWNTGAAIRAVRLADGMPAWPTGSASHDTRVFPRGSGAAPAGLHGAAVQATAALSTAGGRAYAVLEREAGEALVCLDLSPAAEGRLVWLVDVGELALPGLGLPGVPLVCDGPPLVDHELCCVVLRPAGGRDELVLAAFAAADGRLEWTRRCGTAIAADGVDYGRGRRRPVFVEDRIVLATHAGAVVSFDRVGRQSWRTETPGSAPRTVETAAAAQQVPLPPAMPDAVGAGGLVVVAPRDAGGVVAIDARAGAVAWRWAAGDAVVGLLEPVEDGVVVVTRTAGDATGLVRLDRVSGDETVRPLVLAGRDAGPVTLLEHTLFRPRSRTREAGDGGVVLEVFDPVSLASRPLSIDIAPSATAADADSPACFVAGGGGRLAVAVPGAVVCLEGATAADEGGTAR